MTNSAYQRYQEYAESMTTKTLYHLWMTLGEPNGGSSVQGISLADWEQIVWDELVARGIFKNDPAWKHPIQFVQATIKTVQKEHRKREHKKVLKTIDKYREKMA